MAPHPSPLSWLPIHVNKPIPAVPTDLQKAERVAVELERPPCEVHSPGHHAGLEHLAQNVNVVDAGPHRGHDLGACGEQIARERLERPSRGIVEVATATAGRSGERNEAMRDEGSATRTEPSHLQIVIRAITHEQETARSWYMNFYTWELTSKDTIVNRGF